MTKTYLFQQTSSAVKFKNDIKCGQKKKRYKPVFMFLLPHKTNEDKYVNPKM